MNQVRNTRLIQISAAAALTPALFCAVFGSLSTILINDITASAVLGELFGYLSDTAGFLCLFVLYACLTHAFVKRRSVRTVLLLCVGETLLRYAVLIIENAAFYGKYAFAAQNILMWGVNLLFDLLRVLVMALILRHVSRKTAESEKPSLFSLKDPLSAGTVYTSLAAFGFYLAVAVLNMTVLLLAVGAPQSFSEAVTLATPYVSALIRAFLGYLAAILTGQLIVPASGGASGRKAGK